MSILVQRRLANPDLKLPDSLHPLLRRIYCQRKIDSVEELQLGLDKLLLPAQLKGLDAATGLLQQALTEQQRVLIVSDFDADGATSCALAVLALRQFGFDWVDYIVPNRFEFGYGLTPGIVELAKAKRPDLIVTVDNGISSIDGVAAAVAAGIRVLVTDHHLPADELPAAAAIVNPNQDGCEFPSKCIAGVGVIFYVMLALRSCLRQSGWIEGGWLKQGKFKDQPAPEPNMADFLDLVALGTVADVVPLDRNNRILVDEGLKRIRAGRARPGIVALLDVAKRSAQAIGAADLGFSVGPRLNAAGRLDDMSTGIECLMTANPGVAHRLALELDGMNKDRKQIESDMREQAFQYLDEITIEEAELPAALCLCDPRWHQGVVGILASRVKDKYHRPVIAFAEVEVSGAAANEAAVIELKGSARSIKGFHIRDALDAVASRHPGLVSKFGGHAMAAGLSLDKSKFELFKQAFQEEAERLLDDELLRAKLFSDGELRPEDLSLDTAKMLAEAGPWGQEFPEPSFDGRFLLIQQRQLGDKHLKMVLSPLDAPQHTIDAIAFNLEASQWPLADSNEIELVYRLSVNEFRGNQSVQLMVERILGFS